MTDGMQEAHWSQFRMDIEKKQEQESSLEMREKRHFTVLCGFLKNSDIYSNLDGEPAEQQSDMLQLAFS